MTNSYGYPRLHSDDAIEPNDPPVPLIPRGRAAPPADELHFDIRLDGETIGTVYPRRLTGAAQLDLEDAKSTRQIIAWLVEYAGGDAAHVEAMLRRLPLGEIKTFILGITDALTQSIALGNASGPRS